MIGIGIDTGGTYTDAVVFDTNTREILSSAKSLTTHRDLKEGILNSLNKLDRNLVEEADYLALSTTLATNACVEDKGARAKLIFLGVDPKAVEMVQGEYGLPRIDEICFLDCEPANQEALQREPDWDAFREKVRNELNQFECFAIVQIFPHYNGGIFEKKAEEIIGEELGAICVRGYDLYQELNVQKRGATALLNARLLPVMQDFFDSIDRSLEDMGLDLHIYVMKSDGSIMGRDFAMTRPVETLLCGPAASINGAMELTGVKEGMVIDMGGTTSDIGFIRNGYPVASSVGVRVGDWNTMVKGVDIDTFALGGDSGVMMRYGELYLGERRSIPLCIAADTWPSLKEKMRKLLVLHIRYTHVSELFLALMRKPESLSGYTAYERKIIELLADEPMSFQELANRTGIAASMLNRHKQRLEDEGIIMPIGLTPTDIMHIYGDYRAFDDEVSRMGVQWMSNQCNRSKEEMCREIYELVEYKLYRNLVRILVRHQTGEDMEQDEDSVVEKLMREYFYSRCPSRGREEDPSPKGNEGFISMRFIPPMGLISTGAPTGIFLPTMEALFESKGIKPEYAHVANAVGAVAGTILSEYTIRIIRYGESGFTIIGGDEGLIFQSYRETLREAEKIAVEKACEKARKQGVKGELHAEIEKDENFYSQVGIEEVGTLIETRLTASVRIKIEAAEDGIGKN